MLGEIFSDYTLRTVSIGSAVVGACGAVIGSFAVLRRQSLVGDALTHSALPGIVLAFIVTGSKDISVLLTGAFISAFIGAAFMRFIIKNTQIKEDTSLGIVLSVFFGLGIVLLTYVQKQPDATQAGLETFLFGQAATIMQRDVVFMSVVMLVILGVVFTFWKEFKLLVFDAEYGQSSGFNMRYMDILLTVLMVLAIVLGLQTVGVVLMSAMVVAPAASARQWTDKMGIMVLLSAVFGAFSAVIGAVVSSLYTKLPTGPVIVVVLSSVVFVSLVLSPRRGIFWQLVKYEKNKRALRLEATLAALRELSMQHEDKCHGHEECVLRVMKSEGAPLGKTLRLLSQKGWATEVTRGKWAITEEGLKEADKFLHLIKDNNQ